MNKKIVLIIGLIIVSGVAYGIFASSRNNQEPSIRQVVGNTPGSAQGSVQTSTAGREFVTQLLAIQSINFNLDIFNDPVFRNLSDFSQVLERQPVGRQNPFAPIGNFGASAAAAVSSRATSSVSTTNTTTSTRSNTTSGSATRVVSPARAPAAAPAGIQNNEDLDFLSGDYDFEE